MEVCYLCGAAIEHDRSVDHVPAKQFFAKSYRDQNLGRLVTLPSHGSCNKSYQSDEEYFAWSLAPIALESPTGLALARENASKFVRGSSIGLGFKTLKEFEERPSGLYLPDQLVLKRVERKRLARVAWKIVRGLYRLEVGSVLPEATPFIVDFFEPQIAPSSIDNELWELVKAQDGKGAYPGAFDYKYLLGNERGAKLHCWGLLFWDQIIAFVAHRDPDDATTA